MAGGRRGCLRSTVLRFGLVEWPWRFPPRGDNAKTIPIVQRNMRSRPKFAVRWRGFASHLVFVWYCRARGSRHDALSRNRRGRHGLPGGGRRRRRAACSAAGRAGSANIWTDPEGALANILAAARAALAEAGGGAGSARAQRGARASPGPTCRRPRSGSPGGCPSRGRGSRPTRWWRSRARSATSDGIAAALGTGSVFGVQRGGAVRMIGGWGFLLGDQGSGARHRPGAARGGAARPRRAGRADAAPRGRCSPSTAAPAGDRRLRPGARRRPTSPGWRRGSSTAAAAGDPAARGDPARAPRRRSRGAIDRLMADGPVPVCFLGGLGPVFAARLAAALRRADPRAARAPALDGALLAGAEAGVSALFTPEAFADEGAGPLYLQLTPADRRGDRSGRAEAGREPAARARAGEPDRAQPGHGAQGGAGAGPGRAAGAAARLGHLRRAAGRAGRAGAVAAHLVLRGHGAARQGGALGLAVAARCRRPRPRR